MHAVVMAGGVGTRFWPRSRRARPKQLLPIASGSSMLRLTVDRLLPLLPLERLLVVTGTAQAEGVRREIPDLPADNLLVEPVGRNTAPCIGLAAAVLRARGAAQESMVVLAADHVIAAEERFRAALGACDEFVRRDDHLLTLGIRPTRAETGYGYIRAGAAAFEVAGQVFHPVERFVEKPDAATARRLFEAGGHLWNSGMFVWRVQRILDELERHVPPLGAGLRRLEAAWGTSGWQARLNDEYLAFPSVSIDYAVMEKAADIWVAAVDIGWSDVGSWASLPELRGTDPEGNVLPAGSLALQARGNIVEANGKTVVLLGVSDLIVVDEPDALLVCHRDQAQQVGEIPERLRRAGRESLT